jgi:hypothetical protein
MIDQRPTVVLYNDEQFDFHITQLSKREKFVPTRVEGERQNAQFLALSWGRNSPRLGKSGKAETQAAILKNLIKSWLVETTLCGDFRL